MIDFKLAAFKVRLERADWFYDYSDDGRVYANGEREKRALLAEAKAGGETYMAAYNKEFIKHFPTGSPPFKISEVPQGTDENQTTNNKTTLENPNAMNPILETLNRLLLAIIAGFIAIGEALSGDAPEVTVTSGGGAGGGSETPATGGTRGGRGSRGARNTAAAATTTTAPAKADTPAEPEAGALTAEVLREMATPLVQAGRGAEVKKLTQKYGANSMGELDPKHYQDVANGIEALLL